MKKKLSTIHSTFDDHPGVNARHGHVVEHNCAFCPSGVHQSNGHSHGHSHSFKDTFMATSNNTKHGKLRVKVETKIQGFLTGCSSKKINFSSHSLSKKSTFADFKTAISSLANDISGKHSAKDMPSSLTDLGEFLTRQPKPVDFKKRKQIALLYELLKYSRKNFSTEFNAELGSKFKRDKRYSGDQLANNQFKEVEGTYKDSTAWTSYLKDYLLYADCHSTTQETLILETNKAKCQVDDKFDDKVVVKPASSVHGVAEPAKQPTPPKLEVTDHNSCCHNGKCSKHKISAHNLTPTDLNYNPTDVDDAIKRIWGFDDWTHKADKKFREWLKANAENPEQKKIRMFHDKFHPPKGSSNTKLQLITAVANLKSDAISFVFNDYDNLDTKVVNINAYLERLFNKVADGAKGAEGVQSLAGFTVI